MIAYKLHILTIIKIITYFNRKNEQTKAKKVHGFKRSCIDLRCQRNKDMYHRFRR